MIRSALALAALLGLAISSGVAYGCGDDMQVSTSKQTFASTDGQQSKPVVRPSTKKDG
jgi:hypothetical protein